MDEIYMEVPNNPVPYRATRTFPNVPNLIERRFEPSWARNSSYSSGLASNRVSNTVPSTVFTYTRDDIFSIINSISIHPPPPRNLQAFETIFSKDTSVSIKLLDKFYYEADPSEYDHTHSFPSKTNPKTFESRGLSGRGRGRGLDYYGSWGSANSSSKWPTRGPMWRSRFSSESADLSYSQPRRRFLSESSYSDTFSEEMPESPIDKVPDWQFFPNDETYEQDNYERQIPPKNEKRIILSTSQQNELEGRELSWSDTSSFIKTKKRIEPQAESVPPPDKEFSKVRESDTFSFLNPSNVDAADPISNTNQSNSISNDMGDSTKHSEIYLDEFDTVQPSNSDLQSDSQDPKHLWYYVDPKGSIQGPFLSKQMDNWYSREFFPPTLPVWRESDPKPFKLANLLNLTNMSDEPFSVGAGQLLMPREFSPVDIPVREIISEFIDDTQEVVGHQNDQIDTELGLKQFPLKSDKFEEVMTVERNVNQKEITSGDSTPDGHAAKVDIPENIEVFQITQMEFVNEITNKPFCSDVIPIPDTCNSETEPVGKNNRFSGPPKIPELNGSLVDTPSPLPTSYTSHSVQGKTEDDTTTVKAVPIQKQPIKEGSKKPENQIYKEKSKSTSFVSHDPVAEDDSHWKKVGDKKHKAKINKVTQPNFNNDALQVEESVLSNTKYISQSKNSAHRPKLDELDSFSINKQNVKLTPPVFIPNPQDEASIVNLDVILTEQSLEEVSNKNLKRTMLSTRKLEEATQQAKKHTWTTNPTDTLPLSFLAIESEQKKTFSESLAQAEKIRIKESQTNNQPVSVSTWARITKNLSESSDEPGSGIGETAANKRTNTKPVAPIAETDETIGVSFIKSKSEDFIKPKQKELATKLLAPRNIPDGILLSQACYEWSRKEILFLNKLVDPATVICFLQEFNELFEMTQLGSEMLGTSERTNALCKRIYEDLARIKKTKQKFTRSQENGEDWIKVSKKSGKTTKKKGKPSKSSEN